jgi:erythromycin esterase
MGAAADKGVYPLATSRDLDGLIRKIGDSRIVLLGEASHGTHEYYAWRAAITRRLVEEKGFRFIAVEGDWPDCYRVNRYVKGFDQQDKKADEVLRGFDRWPTWMWANWEIAGLVQWLKEHNERHQNKVGFYGLDVYSLWDSMQVLIDYLKKNDPGAARIAEKALLCFSGKGSSEQQYALKSLTSPCRDEVVALLKEMRLRSPRYNHDPEAELNTVQNAHIAVEAEKYYRNMVQFDDNTWNIRDRHMMETLNRLIKFHGAGAKAVIWEHNTHVGDARYTDMAASGTFNVGQLVREQYAGESFVVGFGSYSGTVLAASAWEAPMCEMEMPEAQEGSVEEALHNESDHDRVIIFEELKDQARFNKVWPHRAVGVVYDPENEKYNYVPSHMSRRYDAFIYLDQTEALHPLQVNAGVDMVPDTYPFEF